MCIQLTILVFWFVRTEFRKTRMYVTSRLEIKKNVRALKSFLDHVSEVFIDTVEAPLV